MNTGEVQGRAQPEVSNTVAVGLGNPFNHAVPAEAPQIVGHLSLRDQVGQLPGEQRELLSQITVCEAAGNQTKPDQQMPERQHTQVGGAESRGALAVDLDRTVQPVQRLFSHGAVLAETLDLEQTSVGLKADLPQCGQITQPFADGEVSRVVNRGPGPRANFPPFG